VFRADKKRLLEYNLTLMAKGIFFLPGHCGALSIAHSEADFEKLFNGTEDYLGHNRK
jgi:glutamate-1-semialdehyde aminotransferase